MREVNLFVVFVVLGFPCLAAAEPTVSTTSTTVVTQGQLDDMVQDAQKGGLRGYLVNIRKWAKDPKVVSYDYFVAEYECFFFRMGFTITTLKELGTSQEELIRLLQSRRKITPAHERKKAWMRDRMVDSYLFRGKWK